MLVKKEWLEVKKIRIIEVVIEGVDLLDKVRKYKTKDDEVVNVMTRWVKTTSLSHSIL